MKCPDCGNEMEYDGWGYDIKLDQKEDWWLCKHCDKMHKTIKK